jgi:chaperonin cofactor prefoldin
MDHLRERLDTLEHHVRTLEQQSSSALRRLRRWLRRAKNEGSDRR